MQKIECKKIFIHVVNRIKKVELLNHSVNSAILSYFAASKLKIDPYKAFIIGLLHDIGKTYNKEEINYILKKLNISDYDSKFPSLYHCILSKYYAQNVLKISDSSILRAIRYHSMGCENYDKYLMIIFNVDILEYSRQFSVNEKYRNILFKDLIKITKYIIDYRLKILKKKNKSIHKNIYLFKKYLNIKFFLD